MKKRFTISLEEDLCDEIDENRGLISRSTYIEHLLFGVTRKGKEEAVHGYA